VLVRVLMLQERLKFWMCHIFLQVCTKIVNFDDNPQLGDVIRDEIRQGTDIGNLLVKYTSKGQLAPDELILQLVIAKLKAYSDQNSTHKGFILDGFPRTQHQAEIFHATPYCPTHVINLDQRIDIIIRKISGRRICSNCGENYNVEHIIDDGLDMPPMLPKVENICDRCGAKDSLVQRNDDKMEVVRSRMESYKAQTAPLIEFYQQKGVLREFRVNGGTKELLPGFVSLLKED
jgi:adenylate kinase